MDNEQERYQHFQGYAELLFEDLKPDMTALFVALGSPLSSRDVDIMWAERLIKIKLAQRAYDLAWHIYNLAPVSEYEWRMSDIPDLTEWPNPPQPSPEPASD